ncbi:hypothetical protein ABH944_004665 [Caballeronia udeis]|uniref:Uncharacterized protein n=1 Tax=Caballeronia udeis TaxID=1232866 RepID=A0ABW8MK56_9BURK
MAPLYAGLIAIMNANLGHSVGFITPSLYSLGSGVFRDVSGPPGPANNSFDGTTGYPATAGWNACTGMGGVNGTALQAGLGEAPPSWRGRALKTVQDRCAWAGRRLRPARP